MKKVQVLLMAVGLITASLGHAQTSLAAVAAAPSPVGKWKMVHYDFLSGTDLNQVAYACVKASGTYYMSYNLNLSAPEWYGNWQQKGTRVLTKGYSTYVNWVHTYTLTLNAAANGMTGNAVGWAVGSTDTAGGTWTSTTWTRLAATC
jgi:hypothetical protein